MDYFRVGTPLLFLPNENQAFPEAIGMIVEVDEESVYPYRCIFDDGDEDWYADEEGFVEGMVNNFMEVLNGNTK